MSSHATRPRVTLYIATSLDGYIADAHGGVGFLSCVEREDEDYGYAAFFAGIDGLVSGSITYEQALSFDTWPWGDKPCWVCSARPLPAATAQVMVAPLTPAEVLQQAAARGLRHLWLVGGARLAASFRATDLIDCYVISVVPMLLGAGIALFVTPAPARALRLVDARTFPSGLVQSTYEAAGGA